ncbi:MAG: glycosyltransferase family 2 protein [Kiritimatiellae bacterium]|nr:glycosyltransferase family 2 protein [Kiritimatiellia bacterium]
MTAAVVLHYNRMDLTVPCCETLLAQDEPPSRVIVVDNGSTAHDAAVLRAALPAGVDTIRLDPNGGFAAAMNTGMREALGDPAVDAVAFLNNDTRCPPETLRAMRAELAADPEVGIVGCDMTGAGGGGSALAGCKMHPVFCYARQCREGEEPDYLQGSCLMLPRDVLESTGGFDEGFRFYFEDADLSLRVKRLGRTAAVAKGVRILHYGAATLGAHSDTQFEWYRASYLRFLRKWRRFPRLRAAVPVFGGVARDLFRGRFRPAARYFIAWLRA